METRDPYELLRLIEWQGPGARTKEENGPMLGARCPFCHCTKEIGHSKGCSLSAILTEGPRPIPMHLDCPYCHAQHIDEGKFATKPHHTHACQTCGRVWRPALVPTVGVQFLPGFKNHPEFHTKQRDSRGASWWLHEKEGGFYAVSMDYHSNNIMGTHESPVSVHGDTLADIFVEVETFARKGHLKGTCRNCQKKMPPGIGMCSSCEDERGP